MINIELTDNEMALLKAILFKISIDALHAKTLVSLQDKVLAVADHKGVEATNGSR